MHDLDSVYACLCEFELRLQKQVRQILKMTLK